MMLNECGCGCGKIGDCASSERPDNYMFFGNLNTIKDQIEKLLQMDPEVVDKILADGHAWAVDHISTSLDDIDEVTKFLVNQTVHMGGHRQSDRHSHHKMDPFAEKDVFVKTFESYINEAKKKDQDDDGDSDFADAKIAQYMAGGMSKEEAIKKSRKFNKNKK